MALAKKLKTTAYAYPVYRVSENAIASVVRIAIERNTAALSVDKASRRVLKFPECLALVWIRESEVSFMKRTNIQMGAPIKATTH